MATNKQPPSYVRGIIYKALCIPTQKCYIGQTRTHYREKDTYFETGAMYRWKAHVVEAMKNSDKTPQCRALNRAIRKYGEHSFKVETLKECELIDLNNLEEIFVKEYNSLSPCGYNLTSGGRQGAIVADETREQLSISGIEYFKKPGTKEKKSTMVADHYRDIITAKYTSLKIQEIEIKPIKENKVYKIVYLYIKEVGGSIHRVRIGGIHMSFNDSWKRAHDLALFILNNDSTRLKIPHLVTDSNDEVMKYQSKADLFKDHKINKVLVRKHTYHNTYIITLFIYTDKYDTYSKRKKIVFGGPTIEVKKAYQLAIDFIKLLGIDSDDKSIVDYCDSLKEYI